MTEREAFDFFDDLIINKKMTYVSRFGFYRILMDVHGIDRDTAYKFWMRYEQDRDGYNRAFKGELNDE